MIYLLYIVVALVIPIILVDYPPPDERARRFGIAIVSGIVGGIITGVIAPSIAPAGAISALVFAASAGTVLYGIGHVLLGARQ
ncbi:MAG: hypothetical protein IRY93_07005 [Chthoniobacterales bacterium]|jgi:hypothetical protein|nr:hypothetical protein [Chthoniobacterales bacterium]